MKMMLFFSKVTRIGNKLLFAILTLWGGHVHAQIPQVNKGRLYRWENFPSQFIGNRTVDIWAPEIMDDTIIAYQVLYMNDGLMLFDSSITWNHLEWHVDESIQTLIEEGKVPPTLVVGIWNGGSKRHSEFFPEKVFRTMNDTTLDWCKRNGRNYAVAGDSFQISSDAYLKFIVHELKPAIDAAFFVKKSKEYTFVAGSSMGGLISMYAMCEYPEVFGGAMCFSSHWPGVWTLEGNPIPQQLLDYMDKNLPDPQNHFWYFDFGDQTLDALYPTIQARVDAVLHKHGNNERNWITRFFGGDDHSERSWSRRFPDAFWWLSTKANP